MERREVMSIRWKYGITEDGDIYRDADGVSMQRYDERTKEWVDDNRMCIVFTDHIRSKRLTRAEVKELIGK
jgi:hypothetical protein